MKIFLAVSVFLLLGMFRSPAQQSTGVPHNTYGVACEQCHTTKAWKTIKQNVSFDHSLTKFTLDGEHQNVQCNTCHHGQGINTFSDGCAGCHEDKHRAEFGSACENCHSPQGWRTPGTFIVLHEATRFPLLGAHRMVDCRNCHTNQQKSEFAPLPFECAACHRKEYELAQSIDHLALQLPLECERCHAVEQPSWKPASYDHSKFPLTGAHTSLLCQSCHKGGFDPAGVNCIDCHRADYNDAVNPNHGASNFPLNCSACHSSNSWKPAQFNHDATRFPLRGRHIGVLCESCHKNSEYTGTPTDCYACHQTAYASSTNPNHQQSSFPTDCKKCHTVNGWTPTTFDHKATHFPLTGAHTSVACTKCHINNRWSGLSSACIDCHRDDFNNVNNPDHRKANFPEDCTVCHSTSRWTPSTFDHDGKYFPVYSGEHHGKWNQCEECHTHVSNYKLYSCIDCHEHNKTDMDKKHRGESGYSYVSSECLRCHPKGK